MHGAYQFSNCYIVTVGGKWTINIKYSNTAYLAGVEQKDL